MFTKLLRYFTNRYTLYAADRFRTRLGSLEHRLRFAKVLRVDATRYAKAAAFRDIQNETEVARNWNIEKVICNEDTFGSTG